MHRISDADLDAVEARLETEMEAMAFPPAKPFGKFLVFPLKECYINGTLCVDHEPVSDDDEAGHDHAPAFAALDDMFDVDGTNPLANDYVYFDVSKLNNWAGPQHWKFKKTVPPAQRKRAAGMPSHHRTKVKQLINTLPVTQQKPRPMKMVSS